MTLRQIQNLSLSISMMLTLNSTAFADSGTSCSGPECVVLAGVMLALSGADLRPATAEKMDSMPGSFVIFCKQQGAVPEMSFPCGPTEVDIVKGSDKESLNFRGGKIVIPQVNDEDKLTIVIRARGCKENQTFQEIKSGDVVALQLSASCTK